MYRGTTTILYDCAAISFIPDQFSTSVSFYSPIILFSHYLLWSPGKIRVTEEEEERLVAKREQSALQPDMCRSWALRHYQGFDLSGEASQFNTETSGCPSFLEHSISSGRFHSQPEAAALADQLFSLTVTSADGSANSFLCIVFAYLKAAYHQPGCCGLCKPLWNPTSPPFIPF